MKLGIHAGLLRAYLSPAGIARLLLPACAAGLVQLTSWPWQGDAPFLIRSSGPDTFALAGALLVICGGVVASRTGCEQAGRARIYRPREFAAAGLGATRQVGEKLLFHLGYGLLLPLLALPALAFAGAASGITLAGLLLAAVTVWFWNLLLTGLGLCGRLIFAAFPLLQAALPMSVGALLLLLPDAAVPLNPVLALQSLSGASFFSLVAPRPGLTLSIYGGMVALCYTAALPLTHYRIRGRRAER